MKQLEVQIMGQGYRLSCPDGGESRLNEAVERVDAAMCRIRDAGKIKARDRIAVLAALNLAFELADRDVTAVHAPPRPAAAPATNTSGKSPTEISDARVAALIERIDRALSEDGQLI